MWNWKLNSNKMPLLLKLDNEKGGSDAQDWWAALIWRLEVNSVILNESLVICAWFNEGKHRACACACACAATSGHLYYKCEHMTVTVIITFDLIVQSQKTDSLGLFSEQNMSIIDWRNQWSNWWYLIRIFGVNHWSVETVSAINDHRIYLN